MHTYSTAGIIFSNLNDNTLSELTQDRTVAAIPFACRYRLVDFCLSNMVNANISHINIVANYNYRSLADHIGSGKDWDLARRKGGINFISPYQTSHTSSSKLYSYHLDALKNMKEYINEFKEEYVVLMDADNIYNIDLSELIRQHMKTDANITIITKRATPDYTTNHPRMMISSVAGKITDIKTGTEYDEKDPEVSLNTFIMKTSYLRTLIARAEKEKIESLTEIILHSFKYENFRSYCFPGYVASVSTFMDYYHCSMEITQNEQARESLLTKKNSPIFTKIHNSVPTMYLEGAKVENSLIADDCVIQGTVINSVISRNVHIAKGAVVKNSVLFWGCNVGPNAQLNCVVADKDVTITDSVNISGNKNLPIYIEKMRKV